MLQRHDGPAMGAARGRHCGGAEVARLRARRGCSCLRGKPRAAVLCSADCSCAGLRALCW
jgi:hypothetical protein